MKTLHAIEPPKSLSRMAFEQLRESILNGEMKAGRLYQEMSLAKELNTSRTPVREGLLELASRGLVRFLPRKGVEVCLLDEDDVAELHEVRLVLEQHFVSKVSSNPSVYDFNDMKEALDQQRHFAGLPDVPAYLKANGRFHHVLSRMCGNRRMDVIYSRILDLIHLSGLQSLDRPERMEGTIDQHARLLEAMRSGDSSLALAVLVLHLKDSRAAALDGLEARRQGNAVPGSS